MINIIIITILLFSIQIWIFSLIWLPFLVSTIYDSPRHRQTLLQLRIPVRDPLVHCVGKRTNKMCQILYISSQKNKIIHTNHYYNHNNNNYEYSMELTTKHGRYSWNQRLNLLLLIHHICSDQNIKSICFSCRILMKDTCYMRLIPPI